MNTKIKITQKQCSVCLLCNSKPISDVWENIKEVISSLIDEQIDITNTNIYNKLYSIKGYYKENSLSMYDLFADYYVDVNVLENKVSYLAYTIKDTEKFILYAATNTYDVQTDGNCVDVFLEKGVVGIINAIEEYIDDIKSRQNERKESVEYHQTICYEKDFNRIYMIKSLADKLSKNCSEQLEKLSEKYTKIV